MNTQDVTIAFPTGDAIVAFIRAHPAKIGTREIAREFGLKNAARVELKRMLRELADDGTIAKNGRRFASRQRCRRQCWPTSPAAIPTAS